MIMQQSPPPRLLVSAREASQMLSVSERTLWSLRARGDVHAIKVLGSIRYAVDDLQAFVDRQKTAANGGTRG